MNFMLVGSLDQPHFCFLATPHLLGAYVVTKPGDYRQAHDRHAVELKADAAFEQGGCGGPARVALLRRRSGAGNDARYLFGFANWIR